jgi:hypothetical protein
LLGGSDVEDSGIVQQNIEAAEMYDGAIYDAGNFVFAGNIRREDESGVTNLASGFFEPILSTTDQGNPSAFASKRDGASAANAAARASDDGNSVF